MAPKKPSPQATIERLLQLWRETKHPRLAELIAAFARAHESREAQAWREAGKLDTKAWKAALTDIDVLDLGALLSVMANGTSSVVADRLNLLAQREADPRVVDALHALIEALPWTSTNARKVWTRTTNMLGELADPRTRAIVEGFDPKGVASYSDAFATWMRERLDKLSPKLPEPLSESSPLDAATTELIDQLSANLGGQARPSATDSLPELLARSLAQPDDLAARMVLADALLELGDPHGEFIQVQIARESAPKDRKLSSREKALLTAHRDRFLGELAPIVRKGSLEFSRGYISACELTDQVHANVLASAIEDPQLGNIRSATGPLGFLLAPKLANVRDGRMVDRTATSIEPLLRCDRPLSFESLALELPRDTDPALFDGCTCLPKLRRLSLSGTDALLLRVTERQLPARVTELVFERAGSGPLVQLVRVALARNDAPGLVGLRTGDIGITNWTCALDLHRADDGSRRAELLLTPPPPDWTGAITHMVNAASAYLDVLDSQAYRVLEVRVAKSKVAESIREPLTELLTRRVDQDRLALEF